MNRDLLLRRAKIIKSIRTFFSHLGFLEVDTPILAPGVIPEPTIELFQTKLQDPPKGNLFLLPSPEIWMKRLLAEGSGNIFQIARCFRNGEEASRLHSHEFLMLEWYEVDADYRDAIDTVERLLSIFSENGAARHLMPPVRRLSVQNAFLEYAKVDLGSCQETAALAAEADRLGLNPSDRESWNDLYHKIFIGKVEEALPTDRPLILEDYPTSIACLAKPIKGTMWRERWELYLDGIEIANCYTELTEHKGVVEYFAENGSGNQTDWTFPDIYTESHPCCTGTALGLDRLIMLLVGAQSVAEAQSFCPTTRTPSAPHSQIPERSHRVF